MPPENEIQRPRGVVQGAAIDPQVARDRLEAMAVQARQDIRREQLRGANLWNNPVVQQHDPQPEPQREQVLYEFRGDELFVPAPEEFVAKKVTPKKVANLIGEIYGVKLHPKAAKAVASHPGEIVKGIELEIENFPVSLDDAEATGFNFVADGSLRNNGVEAVSNPNNTKGLLVTTEALWEKYKIGESNFSDRTSIHVHANVYDFTVDNFKSLTLLYQVFEELLFDLVGHDRANNIFCVPWYEAGITALNHRRIIEKPRDWQKYTALNLHPVISQGTVEFRHMHGHADLNLLTSWLHVIDDLMLSAKKCDYNTLVTTINDLNTNSQYHHFLTTTFPVGWKYLMSNRWEHKLSRGVIEAKYSMV